MPATLRSQLVLAFGTLVLVLAAALSLGLADQDARTALTDQGEKLHLLARGTGTLLAEGMFERMREIELLAAAPPYDAQGQLDLPAFRQLIDRAQATRPQYSWIGVADTSGKVVLATGGLLEGRDVSQRPWFQSARTQPFAGDVHLAKLLAALLPAAASGEPLRFVDFAAPLRDKAGRELGVLGVHATWGWADEVVNTLSAQNERQHAVQVFVLNKSGELIYRPPQVRADVKPVSQANLERPADVMWSDGKRYLTATMRVAARSRVTDMQWIVITRQPMAVAQSESKRAQLKFLGVGLAAALCAMAFAWWLATRFSRSLALIAGAARQIERGAAETEIPAISDIREVFHLSSALRGMQKALRQREAALASANAELETRVLERTSELTAAREKLLVVNEALTALAQRDGLTGIHNRRAADERLTMEMARHRRTGGALALLLIDVDHFKSVNDQLGHQAGDEVLKLVAARLTERCRVTDFVGRFGGEEFVVLLPETGPEGALVAADNLRQTIELNTAGPRRVTVSIGVAQHVEQFSDEAAALRAADEALYEAKRTGRNRVCARSASAVARTG